MVMAIWIVCGIALLVSAAVRLRSSSDDRRKPAVMAVVGIALIVAGFFV